MRYPPADFGRSIYTDEQMKEFYAFQNAAGPEMLSWPTRQRELTRPGVEEIGASLWATGLRT